MYTEKTLTNIFIGMMAITFICLTTAFGLNAMNEGLSSAFRSLAGVGAIAGAIYTPLGYGFYSQTNHLMFRNIGRFGLVMLTMASLLASPYSPLLTYLNIIVGAVIIACWRLDTDGIWVKYTSWARPDFILYLGCALVFGNVISRAFA